MSPQQMELRGPSRIVEFQATPSPHVTPPPSPHPLGPPPPSPDIPAMSPRRSGRRATANTRFAADYG